jgi:diguanylate cyclase (GGDEF)-like protein
MVLRAAWNQPAAGGRDFPVGSAFAPVAALASIRSSACVLTHLDAGEVLHHRLGGTGVVVEIGLEPQDRRSQAVGVVRLGFDGVSPDWDDANADIVALMCSTLLATIQRCAEERRVNEESKLDPLTRLLNRSALLEQLTGMMDGDGPGRPVVLFADLNAFKQLNDTYGHREGDVVLRTVAQAIVAEVRGGDLAARIGGDEFVIVFDAPTETAGALVARIRGAVDLAIAPWRGVSVAVGAIAVGPDGTADDVLERADLAMYKDKRSTSARTERAARAADGLPPVGHSGLIRSPFGRQERS